MTSGAGYGMTNKNAGKGKGGSGLLAGEGAVERCVASGVCGSGIDEDCSADGGGGGIDLGNENGAGNEAVETTTGDKGADQGSTVVACSGRGDGSAERKFA